jgi:hypothetical protein
VAGVPADRDDARLGRHFSRRGEDRLLGGQARRAQALRLYPHCHLPVGVADLRAQVHLEPGHHVAGIDAEHLRVERVPALLEVGQEDGVIDVALGVGVTPPDPDQVLERRGHVLAP